MILVTVISFWLVCAFITAGIFVASFQHEFPSIAKETYRQDLGMGVLYGLICGPVGLVVSIFTSGFCQHGWTLKRPKLN